MIKKFASSPVSRSLRKNNSEDRKERILNAAEKAFSVHGFQGATTADIAKNANISKSQLHYYFEGKEDIYLHLLEKIIIAMEESFEDSLAAEDPKEIIRNYIEKRFVQAYEKPEYTKIVSNEIISGAPYILDYLKTHSRKWVEKKSNMIQSWIDNGLLDPIDPTLLILNIWASTIHYADYVVAIKAVMGTDTLTLADYKRAANQYSDVIIKGCGFK